MEWTSDPPDQGKKVRKPPVRKPTDPREIERKLRRERVKELAETGLTPRQIAPKIGVSYSTVVKDFHHFGYPVWDKNTAKAKRQVEVQALFDKGLGAKDIAKRLRVGTTTVQNDFKDLGISKHPRRGAHQHQASVIEDVMSMLRAAAATLEQYDFEAVNGDEEWLPDAQGLKRWRRDLNGFHKQMRRVQNMITETQKEQMR